MEEMLYTKEELKEQLKSQISADDNKAIHALMEIYSYQNDYEKNAGHTVAANGVGFSGVDSEFMTSLAKQYNINGVLSPNQKKWVRKVMPKYAGQLLKISFAKGNFEKVGRKWRIKK